jgi:hypothetical protein
VKLRLLSVDISMYYSFPVKLLLICVLIFGFSMDTVFAANNKKKKKKGSGDKVSITRRAYEDITTRNNYYFNANLQWKETVEKIVDSRKVNYDSILPLYFHENANLKSYNTEWDAIIKRMGLVMQMHDYTRWKDDAFLLLGMAHFMKGEHAKALQTFQYISTTMKGKIGQEKQAVTNKERLKLIREMEKERKKKSKEKQKVIEFNLGIAKKESEEKKKEALSKADEAKKAAQQKTADRQKVLKEKAKLKEKYLTLKSRGKKVDPTFSEYYLKNSKYAKDDESLALEEDEESKPAKAEKVTPTAPPDYSKLRLVARDADTTKLSAIDRTEEAPLADSLKRKELDKKSDLSLWEKIKHKPGRPDAVIWMAKTLMERNDDETAHALIQYGQSLSKLTRKNKRDLQVVETYYYLRRKNYDLAQGPLVNAIELTKKKGEEAWYTYMLAQLQEQTGQHAYALENYRRAGKLTNEVEMSFYSRMGQARLYGKQGLSVNEEALLAKLRKMVRGGKNKAFADQVYFSMAELSLNRRDTAAAITHLLTAASLSTGNLRQKGLSYLLLTDIAIEQDRYPDAKIYIDSAMAALPNTYPGIDAIKSTQLSLAAASQFATTIREQDSIMVLAAMSDTELYAYLDVQEQQETKEDKKKNRKKNWTEGEASGANLPQLAAPVAAGSSGSWYFYNNDLRARGYNEFIRVWGDRGLEDGWRRSEKSSFSEFTELISKQDMITPGTPTLSIADVADKTQQPDSEIVKMNIPRTEKEKSAIRGIIGDALYNLGFELRAGMQRPDKALPYFMRLLTEFSGSSLEPQVLYNAYLAASEMGNAVMAEHFKGSIMSEYPGTEYARFLLSPPNLILTRDKPRSQPTSEEVYYASTYDLFNGGEYAQVVSRRQYALENYKGGKYIPQFEFLGALSLGYLDQVAELKSALTQIILKYPNTEVQKKAQEYLRYLAQDATQSASLSEEEVVSKPELSLIPQAPKTPYDMGDNNLYFMAYFPQKEAKLEEYKQKLAFLGDENFGKDKYKVSNAFLDNNQTVLLSKRFKTAAEAQKYMQVIATNKRTIFGSANVEFFIISQSNFRVFFDTKDVASYRIFHDYYFK